MKSNRLIKINGINIKMIAGLLGLLMIIIGLFMMACLPFSLHYEESSWKAIVISATITIVSGILLQLYNLNNKNRDITKRDGYLVVTLGWLFMALFGSLPYVISGAIPNFTDAFFETMSGFTTTGATILTDIEALPHGLLFWRSLTQWIGGMGIIVLTIAILPILGIGGMQLFVAEAPGISPDKLHPRITQTAKRLWIIYFSLTLIEMTLLRLAGMNFFDAVNHALTTMASGGFSTKQDSIAGFESPMIHYIIIFFMFLAGINFTLIFFGFSGKIKKVWKNEEFRIYLFALVIISVIASVSLYFFSGHGLEQAIRDGTFQVVSIVTTTGYVTGDYISWNPFLSFLFFILMFSGGSAGSTAGGIKIVRHIVLIKNSVLELKRLLHPSAVIPVRLNKKAISSGITYNIAAFILIYIIIFFIGAVTMSILGYDFTTSIGAVTATLGNVGPGIGGVGPAENYAFISPVGKWFLSFFMLLGRLELFTVLILFTPYFWRKR